MTDIRVYSSRRDSETVIASRKAESRTAFTDKKTAFSGGFYFGFIRCITEGRFTVYRCELTADRRYRGKPQSRRLTEQE